MLTANPHFADLQGNYLFADIARKVRAYREANPDSNVISLGIGDVTQPLAPSVLSALHKAVDEMGTTEAFRGYGPEQGYVFLREAICEHDYRARGITIAADEVFVSDGAKSDLGNFQELFGTDCLVAITDPVYPVYVDSNTMAGRKRILLPCRKENAFVPEFPATRPDLIYLCYPNNPTGTTLSRDALKAWVDYARKNGCVILYDSAYEAYITDADIPHSIYEIDGAREVAVEFRSFSKTAGFTGLRCAYTVVPGELQIANGRGDKVRLRDLWFRRQCTKYNGCPYIVQRAAEAVYSPEGKSQIMEAISVYQKNAGLLRAAAQDLGLGVHGGVNAPYIWLEVPQDMDSWGFFEHLLHKAGVVCTPGAGFGAAGEGYVRLTAFGSPENTQEAIRRIQAI